jgi:membrane-bound lytic murein transglycosylase MltF
MRAVKTVTAVASPLLFHRHAHNVVRAGGSARRADGRRAGFAAGPTRMSIILYDPLPTARRRKREAFLIVAALIAAAILAVAACDRPAPGATPAAAPAAPASDSAAPAPELVLPAELSGTIDQVYTGDFDGLVKRRLIRAGVPFNRTYYFVDMGQPRGLSYEYLMLLEQAVNKKLGLKKGEQDVHIVLLPMPRDQLLPALQKGKIDIVVAQLTVTPERQKLVDFSQPTRDGVNEVLVTGPGTPGVASLDDLSGREVFVRRTSSYFNSLGALNTRLKASGKPPVDIRAASESLEDDDLLEMVNAGLIPATVVDDYLAEFWKQVFPDFTIHSALPLTTGGTLAVAMRQRSPQLAAALNEFIAKSKLNAATAAVLNKKYLRSTKFVKNATSDDERKKFMALVALFKKYGDQYQFDYLMMAAQGYQESRLDQNAKSSVGAVGVMQLMPATGKEQKVGNIQSIEPNVHAGVKYMRFIRKSFFDDQPMDDLNKSLFTFAAYNAGPGRIRTLRNEAKQRGLNPNLWFGNVERIASERIGRETVTYVSNIYKYYVAYRLLTTEAARKKAAAATQH